MSQSDNTTGRAAQPQHDARPVNRVLKNLVDSKALAAFLEAEQERVEHPNPTAPVQTRVSTGAFR